MVDSVAKNVIPFSEELKWATAGLKIDKDPELNQIPTEAIKVVVDCLPKWSLDAMNYSSLKKQELPEIWKTAKLVLIL